MFLLTGKEWWNRGKSHYSIYNQFFLYTVKLVLTKSLSHKTDCLHILRKYCICFENTWKLYVLKCEKHMMYFFLCTGSFDRKCTTKELSYHGLKTGYCSIQLVAKKDFGWNCMFSLLKVHFYKFFKGYVLGLQTS